MLWQNVERASHRVCFQKEQDAVERAAVDTHRTARSSARVHATAGLNIVIITIAAHTNT
jgi:hypothetical protein